MAIQIRRGSNTEWETNKNNIIVGEPVVTTDTRRFIVGISSGQYTEFTNTEVIASEYDSTQSYSEGDYCIYNGKLYCCMEETTGTWDSDVWDLIAIEYEIKELKRRTTALETSINALGNVANLTYTVVSTF